MNTTVQPKPLLLRVIGESTSPVSPTDAVLSEAPPRNNHSENSWVQESKASTKVCRSNFAYPQHLWEEIKHVQKHYNIGLYWKILKTWYQTIYDARSSQFYIMLIRRSLKCLGIKLQQFSCLNMVTHTFVEPFLSPIYVAYIFLFFSTYSSLASWKAGPTFSWSQPGTCLFLDSSSSSCMIMWNLFVKPSSF